MTCTTSQKWEKKSQPDQEVERQKDRLYCLNFPQLGFKTSDL